MLNPNSIHLGHRSRVGAFCRFECYSSYHGQILNGAIYVGEKTVIGNYVSLLSAKEITIGDHCLIASNVFITDLNHGIDLSCDKPFEDQPLTVKKVAIGSNCWIGEKSIVLSGVSLGNNTIVAGGSVVTKSFGGNCIIGGNPAKIIKIWDDKSNSWVKPILGDRCD